MPKLETFAELRDRTADLIQFLEANGVRVNPSSRLAQYLKQLTAATKADGVTVPKGLDLPIWHRSLIEVDDLNLVARSLSLAPEVKGWREALSRALGGGAVRTDEVKHSLARDIQFELIIASMFRRANYTVELAEPDVVLTSETPQIGIAAKRPRSMNKLDEMIKKADKQIAGSGLQGIVALDMSLIVSPNDDHITTDDYQTAFNHVKDIANNFVATKGHHITSLVDTAHTFGVIAHLGIPIFENVTPRLAYGRRWAVSNLCELEDPRAETLRTIADRLRDAEGAED
jgi:hypothetical protein